MKINIEVDFKKALDIAKKLPKEGQRAMISSLNKTMSMANTAARREIQSVYNLKAKDFKYKDGSRKIEVSRARPGSLFASLYIKGRRLGFYLFGAKKVAKKGGVSVEIKRGHRFIISHAFIKPWKSGQNEKWVFVRKKEGGKRVGRIPREALFSLSLPELYSTKRVGKKIREVAGKNFFRIFQHEFTARIKGFVAY